MQSQPYFWTSYMQKLYTFFLKGNKYISEMSLKTEANCKFKKKRSKVSLYNRRQDIFVKVHVGMNLYINQKAYMYISLIFL